MSAIYKNGKYYGVGGGGGSAYTEIIADDFDPTESYAVGEYVVYEGTLYKCTTAHTGDWDASNFDDTQVMAEMPTPMPAADMSEVVTPLPGVMSRRFKYSTSEQVIGEWIDGKPLYQKTFNTTSSTTGSEVDISYDANIDTVVNIEGMFHRTDNSTSRWLPMNCYTQSNMYGFICYDMSGKNIKYKLTGYSTDKQIITILYTKTTD